MRSPNDTRFRSSASTDTAEPGTACRLVASATELATHLAIRETVFVHEQRIFTGNDRDERDDDGRTLHVLGFVDGRPVGTVRLYPLDEPGLWKGDRLAVLGAYRRRQLGGPLVRFAVQTAAERGGAQMLAYIQPPNVAFFEHLGWRPVGDPMEYCGLLHQRMIIELGPWRRPW
ncbi:MAG TPA: MSMEG_0567/Sll0786 family nitrogen starvation N-acetyltransferase [Jiangellaceae bacterium]|nr:MSMEG_0567/Sll0786 family nitrogen starvation N-acetyltransferase [Jiangellaceae bacterium]